MSSNPYLVLEDPFPEQRAVKDNLNKQELEFQRLCYELFHMNQDGIKLYELIKERYLLQSLYAPTHQKAESLALYFEGFKEALRGLWAKGDIHKRRIAGSYIQS